MVILIRHAERHPAGNDPSLSPAGKRRAQLLVKMLDRTGVTAIFTSAFKRTKETAAPLVAKLAVTARPIDEDMGRAKAQILAAGACVLVVGHSDTVPAFIAALGGPAVTIEDEEFDRMFVLHPRTPAAAGWKTAVPS